MIAHVVDILVVITLKDVGGGGTAVGWSEDESSATFIGPSPTRPPSNATFLPDKIVLFVINSIVCNNYSEL